MQELASSVEQNSTKIETSLKEIGGVSAQSADELSAYFNLARTNVETAIAPLVQAQQNYAATSGLVAEAEARLVSAHAQDQAALGLLAQAVISAATSSKDLVVVQQLLIETGTEVARSAQQLGGALELNTEAEQQLTSARTNAIQAAEQLVGVQAEILSQASALSGATSSVATATSTLAEASESASGPIATLTELQNNLAAASARLVAAEDELKAAQAGDSAGAVTAAFIEQKAALEEVDAAEGAFQGRIASLNATLAEQKAIMASADVTWIEYAAAEAEVAAISSQLEASQIALAASTDASVASTAAATGAQTQLSQAALINIASLNAVAQALQNAGTVSNNTAGALQTLTNNAAVAQLTNQQFAQVVNVVNQALAGMGVQLRGTAGNLQLLQTAAIGAGNAVKSITNPIAQASSQLTQLGGIMAYVGGRASALAIGLGQLGFALGTLGRASAAIAPIFQALFFVAIPVLLIEAVETLSGKFIKLQDEIRKSTTEMQDLAIGMERSAEATQLQTLKLDDQINKFEGRPTQNRLAEAAIEAKIRVDALTKSLGDALEKEIELLEKADIGIMTGLATGKEPTSIIGNLGSDYDKVRDLLAVYEERNSDVRQAQTAYDKDQTEANARDLAKAKQRVIDAAVEARNETKALIGDTEERLDLKKKAQKKLDELGVLGVADKIPGGRTFLDWTLGAPTGDVDASFAKILTDQKNLLGLLDAIKDKKEADAAASKKQTDEAHAANAEDARQRDLTVKEPDIRIGLEQARLKAQAAKQEADDTLKETEVGIKKQIAAEESGGVEKNQAVLNSIPAYQAALKIHTNALVIALEEEHDIRQEFLERQLALHGEDERGPARTAALKADNQALVAEDEEYERKRLAVIDTGNTAVAAYDAEADQKRFEARIARYKVAVDAERETVRTTIEVSKEQAAQEETVIKGSTENQLRLVQTQEQLHLITSQQALDARLALLEAEQTAIGDAAARNIASLTAQRDVEIALLQKGRDEGIPESALKPALTIIEQLTLAINKAGAAQDQLNAKIDTTKIDAAIQSWKDYEKTITDFVNQSVSAFNGFVENIFTGNRTLAEDFRQLFRSILQDFIKMILTMIEQTALFQSIRTKITDTLSSVFKIPLTPPGAALGGAAAPLEGGAVSGGTQATTNAATLAQINAQWVAHNAQLVALYTQDSAAYAAAQATKTGAAVTSQTAQTASTTVGTSARMAVTTTGTTAVVAQNAIQTTAHAAGQAAQTGATVASQAAQTAAATAGAGARSGIGLIEAIKSIGRAAAVAAAHAFKWVMQEVPFPANIVIAPLVAAAAFAGVLAFGAIAEKGALLDSDMPIFAHAKEMILPSHLSSGLQGMIESGGPSGAGGGGGETHIHVHMGDIQALDSEGVAGVYKRSRNELAKQINRGIRSGHIDPRKAF